MMKTLVVGLDAAPWEYLEPLLTDGRLPALQKLIDSGVSGTMHSTMPAWTPAAWASIITGKNPGKHGVFDMVWRRPATYDFIPTSSQVRMGTPFWKYLNNQGIRVGLVNVPFTYPPEPLDGFSVAGFGTPYSARKVTYPENLLEFIEAKWGRYEPVVDSETLSSGSPQEIFETERAHQHFQIQIAAELAEQFNVEVLVINLMLLDHANHKMPEMMQVNQAIIQCDADIAFLLQEFQPDQVLLFSDHGSRRSKGNFLLNHWLIDRGFLVYEKRGAPQQSKALNWILMQWLQSHKHSSGMPEKVFRRILRQTTPLLKGSVKQLFWDRINDVIPFAYEHFLLSEQVDFRNTSLYPGTIYSGLLYFNIQGRDPNGVLSQDNSFDLFSEISAGLSRINDPDTGEPLFKSIFSAKDLYHGPAGVYGPDLILDNYDIEWNIQLSSYTAAVAQSSERYFIRSRGDFGWHSKDGIFIFGGSNFNPATLDRTGHVMDIPATLLYLYGIPIPDDYDGQILTGLMSPDYVKENPIQHQPGDGPFVWNAENSFSDQEAEELMNHLRALGYVE